jgi:hypothetical protein
MLSQESLRPDPALKGKCEVPSMRDITDLMEHYRVIAREIWNNGFWNLPDLRTWDSWDQFESIKSVLFRVLVTSRLEEVGGCVDLDSKWGRIYYVVPISPGPVPIKIHQPREADLNRYWDDPVREISAPEAELQFLDYFDWNQMGYIDFQYYRVRISAFASKPHLIGREALLDHLHARVFVGESPALDSGSDEDT